MRKLVALAAAVGFSGLAFAHDHTLVDAVAAQPSIFANVMMGAMILVGLAGGALALRAG